jgi:hypothetical protein
MRGSKPGKMAEWLTVKVIERVDTSLLSENQLIFSVCFYSTYLERNVLFSVK